MPKWILMCLCVGIAAVLAACGGDTANDTGNPPNTELSLEPVLEQAAPPEIPVIPEVPADEPAVPADPAAAVVSEEPVEEVAAVTDGLEGSVWKWRDFTITFKEASKLHVMGGQAAEIAPQGLEGTYAVEDGVIEINVLTVSRRGTWDGTSLVLDGEPAQKEQKEA